MADNNHFDRRDFFGAIATLGAASLGACTTSNRQASRLSATDRRSGQLPPQG